MGVIVPPFPTPSTVGAVTIDSLVYNVKDHGAIGNGIADDAAAISTTAAIAAATGGCVYFPPGTYLCNAYQGGAPVGSGGNPRSVIYLTGLTDVNFFGFGATLQTTLALAATCASILELRGCTNCHVSGLNFIGVGIGVLADTVGSANARPSAVRLTTCTDCQVYDNTATGFGMAPFWLTGGSVDCVVARNHIAGSSNAVNEDDFSATDPYVSTPPARNIIAHNIVVAGCSIGVVLDNGDAGVGAQVIGNRVDTTVAEGILIKNAPAAVVVGNHVTGAGTIGIHAYNSAADTGLVVSSNMVEASVGDNYKVDATAAAYTGVSVVGNVSRAPGGLAYNFVAPGNLVGLQRMANTPDLSTLTGGLIVTAGTSTDALTVTNYARIDNTAAYSVFQLMAELGQAADIEFYDIGNLEWTLLKYQGSNVFHVQDRINTRDHILLTPGATTATAITNLDSGLLLGPAATGPTMHGDTGVPGAGLGNNGDFYFDKTGGAGTHIYFKAGGAWGAIA